MKRLLSVLASAAADTLIVAGVLVGRLEEPLYRAGAHCYQLAVRLDRTTALRDAAWGPPPQH